MQQEALVSPQGQDGIMDVEGRRQPFAGKGSAAELHTATFVKHEVPAGACSATLEELEGGLGTTDYSLTSRLGVVRNWYAAA